MSNSLVIDVPNVVKQNTPLRNVPSGSTATPDYSVKYVPQSLTEEQQAQARQNIGAAAAGEGGGTTVNEFHYLRDTTTSPATYYIDADGYEPKEGDLMTIVWDWPFRTNENEEVAFKNPATLKNNTTNPSIYVKNAHQMATDYDEIDPEVNTRWTVRLEKVNDVWYAYNISTAVQADWTTVDTHAPSYIKNKPEISNEGGADVQDMLMDQSAYWTYDIYLDKRWVNRDAKLTVFSNKATTLVCDNITTFKKMEHNGVYTYVNSSSVNIQAGKSVIYLNNMYNLKVTESGVNLAIYFEGGQVVQPIASSQDYDCRIDFIVLSLFDTYGSGWMEANPSVGSVWVYDPSCIGWACNFYATEQSGKKLVFGDHEFGNTMFSFEAGNAYMIDYYVTVNTLDNFLSNLVSKISDETAVAEMKNHIYTYTFMDFATDGYTPRLNNVTKYIPS